MSKPTLPDHMESRGWEFYQCGPNEGDWFKFDANGKQTDRSGSPRWNSDVNEYESKEIKHAGIS